MSDFEKVVSETLTKEPIADGEESATLGAGFGMRLEPAEAEPTVTIPLSTYNDLFSAALKFGLLELIHIANPNGMKSLFENAVENAIFGSGKEKKVGGRNA